MVQLSVPPNLSDPSLLHFEQAQLTEEEHAEERAMPHHPELAKYPTKHATRCLAMAVHYTIHCDLFQNQGSQGTIANKFGMECKRFYCALTGKKYDARRKPTKKEKAEQAAATTAPSKPKVAKQDTTQEDTTQPSEDTTTIDIDSDSLPDPFAPKEMTPKTSGTKEDQSAENIQEEMDTMPELISDDDNDAPPKSLSTKDPTGIPKTPHHHPKKFTTKKPPP